MARPLRVHLPGALYDISSTAAASSTLFRDAEDYETYLGFLREARSVGGCRVFGYALLPDRLQLALELTGETTISTVMHALNSRYTKYALRRYGPVEHVFHERFKSTLMEKSAALLPLTAFLHRLPELTGASSDATQYVWSSYRRYVQPEGSAVDGSGLILSQEVSEVLQWLEQAHPGQPYAQYVRQRSVDELARWEREWRAPAVGSEAFKMAIAQQTRAARRSAENAPIILPTEMLLRNISSRACEPTRGTAVVEPHGDATTLQPHPHATDALRPAHEPSGSTRRLSLALTVSCVVAAVGFCTTLFYAGRRHEVQQALRALLHERAFAALARFQNHSAAASQGASTHLANFSPPPAMTGTVWMLHVRPMSGAAQAEFSDELRFESGKVISSTFGAQGFAPSNYSLTIQSTGAVTWETMQTGPDGEVACWRGEWNGETMQGILTRQVPGQDTVNFRFAGVSPSRSHEGTSATSEI